ncbi:CBN-DAPK-1 protein [Caenorhabditis brenneri]|uniref:CBN-DAPK-1 protein n=1 Tax=Caenorhabditis brenneri TaxID=135651 RepID=G0PGY7_CAEBE|nr:CBN-DAPK-1 protein [Caenorhabditis brenneri]
MSARESARNPKTTEEQLRDFVADKDRFPSDSEEEDSDEDDPPIQIVTTARKLEIHDERRKNLTPRREEEYLKRLEMRKLNLSQLTQTDPSSFDDDRKYIDPEDPEEDPDEDEEEENLSDTDNTIVIVNGSVLGSYLTDPITNPSASYLFESPRPRAADFVYPGQDRYSKLGSVPAYSFFSTTTAFIQLLNDISDTHPDLCECAREETPLHVASARGHVECVNSLLEANSPVDAVDQDGKTALIVALEHENVDIAQSLITTGCDINHADNHGDTALHVAAKNGFLPIIQTLCHCAVQVDAVNENKKTALHLAAHYGHVDVIRILLLARADVTLRGDDGLTAELVAVAAERLEAHSLLKMVKSQETREEYISQLYPLDTSLRRIKLKLLGHSLSGKTRLVQTLHSSRGISSFLESVSRRISDHYSPSNSMKDDGIHSTNGSFVSESNNNSSFELSSTSTKYAPPHSQYTRGIDVQSVNINGCGEFSVWEFGGYEPMHTCYDHFVGNADCIHLVLYRASDPPEVQYKQILYWMNFLKGRVTPFEPIGHCGFSSRRSKVLIVGTHATSSLFPHKNSDGEYTSSDIDALLKTVRLRFETHFDMDHRPILLDATNPSCIGMKTLKMELAKCRTNILAKLLKPLAILDTVVSHLNLVRKKHANFPVISWPDFIQLVRNEINPLTGDAHCRQIVQQLQLIGEIVYLRNDLSDADYVVLNAEWFGTHILGQLLSAEFLSKASPNGSYHTSSLAKIFPEIPEQSDLMTILEVLQLCAPDARTGAHEFPVFIQTEAPDSIWRPYSLKEKERDTVYGGVRILPMRGMERSLHSTFPRIQVALRRSINDYQPAKDTQLYQWSECSKLVSQDREAVIRMWGDAVEIRARGPSETATSMFYFMEDLINLVEQTAAEVGPGISLERHFLSPKHLKEHRDAPAVFPPEAMMEMQQNESLSVKAHGGEEELFTDVVCFGSRDVARHLTLGIDVGVADLQMASRCELACLMDPQHPMGNDWSILAVKLHLTDQVPDVDSTGQSLSRTDQLLNEWAIHHPEQASVGNLCKILVTMGRFDARDALFRTVPLYVFSPIEEHFLLETNDSGVVSSCHSSSEHHPINI